jgi:phosphoglycerate dehydrogenase-like enzyme
LMKKTASLTNFSRARLVDYEALAEKLRTGMLEGAVLDVFDPEPLPSDSDLRTIPNLLITPHCSSDDLKEYVPMTLDLVFRNVARAMSNRGLLNKVDLKREY